MGNDLLPMSFCNEQKIGKKLLPIGFAFLLFLVGIATSNSDVN